MNYWDIYEITADTSSLHGVMLRGRIRKLSLERGFELLAENANDKDNCVRFAVTNESDASEVRAYLNTLFSDVTVELVLKNIANPVLSKLKVNLESRYTL